MLSLDERIERFMKKKYPEVYCPVCRSAMIPIDRPRLYACPHCNGGFEALDVPVELKYADFIKLRYEEFVDKFGEEEVDWYIEEFR